MITTIIPTHRRPSMLRRAIQSVLNQTYPDFQIYIYDNASGDETATVVAEFAKKDSRVHYHCHNENIGMLANFNYGLAQIETRYFSILCDDDLLLPNFFETAMLEFEKHSDAIFASGPAVVMTDKGIVGAAPSPSYNTKETAYFSAPTGLYNFIEGEHPLRHHTLNGILFRQEIIADFTPITTMWFDVNLILYSAARFPICIIHQPCSILVEHADSTSGQNPLKFLCVSFPEIIDHFKFDERIPMEVRKRATAYLLTYYARTTLIQGIRFLFQKNFEAAIYTAKTLENYYTWKKQSVALKFSIFICRKAPFLIRLIKLLYQIRYIPVKRKMEGLQEEYLDLTKFLETI